MFEDSGSRRVGRWKSGQLGMRLGGAFSALVVLMLLLVVVATYRLRGLAREQEESLTVGVPRLLAVQGVVQHANGLSNTMIRLLTSTRLEREALYTLIDEEHESVERLLSGLARDLSGGVSAQLPMAISKSHHQYRSAFLRTVELLESGDEEGAKVTFRLEGKPSLDALVNVATTLLSLEQDDLVGRQRQSMEAAQFTGWLLMCIAGFSAALAAYMAWWTTATVVRPLRRVEEAARLIESGDYSARVQIGGGEEFSQVANAMNAMASAVSAREAEIRNLAYTDRLTGLPNRAMVRRVLTEKNVVATTALVMDVSRLRTVNEVLGYEAGDALLQEIANRLRTVMEGLDKSPEQERILARMPGDTFCVICTSASVTHVEELRALAAGAVVSPVDIDGNKIDVQLVFGMAASRPGDGMKIDDLLRCAEQALETAKRAKRDSSWYLADADDARARQLSLVSNIRNAVAAGQLEMWLQPKQCMRTKRLIGAEALTRWKHPEWGYIAPGEFIPFAERTGHIGVITRAMLAAAARQLGRWSAERRELTIAVNVSAVDLKDHTLTSFIEATCRQHSAPLRGLRLEITESSLMEDAEAAMESLRSLRRLGVQLSVDDFGTGYSSLAYLSRLPVNELKVDRSFVSGADARRELQTLLKTIVDLGHSLDMTVTAEGVETEGELRLLADIGCDVVQGYLISRPLDPVASEVFFQQYAAAQETEAVL